MIARRTLLLSMLAGCAAEAPPPADPRDDVLARPWRSIGGGFLAPPVPPGGLPPRPTGMYAKLSAPSAVAIRDSDLLVADAVGGRLWRADAIGGTFSGIAGAPVGPETTLALGPDLSAWVLDPPSRQVLRFGRDGRLLQTYRAGTAVASPVGFALVDGGATLLLADGLGASWSEQRGPGAIVQLVRPAAQGARVSGVDAIVPARDGLFVLDRLAGLVHHVRRDGSVVETLGKGDLVQPHAIAADRFDRVYVLDAPERAIKVLQSGRALRRLPFDTLGVRQPSAIACDGATLAVADTLLGQVQLLRLARGDGP